MAIFLRRWAPDGRPARLYVNGLEGGEKVWLEKDGDDGVAVRAGRDAGAVDADGILRLLSDSFGRGSASWATLERVSGLDPGKQARRIEASARRDAPAWSAMDSALLDVSRIGKSATSAAVLAVSQSDEVGVALERYGGLAITRGVPAWGDIGVGPSLAFARLTVTDLGKASVALPEPPPQGVRGFALVEGPHPTPSGLVDFDRYCRNLAALALSVPVVPTLSPAHSARMVAEILAGAGLAGG